MFQGLPGIFGSSHASNTSTAGAGIVRSTFTSMVFLDSLITFSPFVVFSFENAVQTDRDVRSRTARTHAPIPLPAEVAPLGMRYTLRALASFAGSVRLSQGASLVLCEV